MILIQKSFEQIAQEGATSNLSEPLPQENQHRLFESVISRDPGTLKERIPLKRRTTLLPTSSSVGSSSTSSSPNSKGEGKESFLL